MGMIDLSGKKKEEKPPVEEPPKKVVEETLIVVVQEVNCAEITDHINPKVERVKGVACPCDRLLDFEVPFHYGFNIISRYEPNCSLSLFSA